MSTATDGQRAGPSTPGSAGASGASKRTMTVALWFLGPALILLAAFLLYPIGYSLVRSLYDKSGDNFIGLGNYFSLFTDQETFTALKNNVIWVIVAPTVVTIFGLFFAVLTERIKWATAFKTLIFMPMAISFLASGVIFRLVYDQNPDRGVLNAVLVAVHDTFLPSANYPGGRPSVPDNFTKTSEGGYATKVSVSPDAGPANLALVAISPDRIPSDAKDAQAVQGGKPDAIAGTVWVDFVPGGGGEKNAIDDGEKGLPEVTVQALQNGQVAGSDKTDASGVYTITGLAAGDYTLRMPGSNFAEPYDGLTWLGPKLVTGSIIGAYIWIYAGFAMVLLAAGMSAIPRDALEAARIDGASEWQVFRKVTMPLLSPVIVVVFVTLVINVLKLFDLVYIIAPASVQPEANVLALQMWRVSFGGAHDQGLGSAISIFLLLLVIPVMIFNIRKFRQERS